MEITDINQKEQWDKILEKFSSVCFLQSWDWGEFQESQGNKVRRVVAVDKDQSIAAQYYIKKSRLFTYLYLPRGPVGDLSLFVKLLDRLKEECKQEGVDFIVIEPSDKELDNKLAHHFLKQASIQPGNTSLISLTSSIALLQSNLRKTTRQMIKKATESGVIIKTYTDLSRWDEFIKLFNETTQRQKFNPHSLEYMKKQLQIFSRNKQAKLYLAELSGQAIAGAIIVSYHKTSIYLHAASSSGKRKIGAAHLLVWKAILEAKEKGDEFFDLWGVAPEDDPHHPFAGISIFKFGFGGKTVSYPGGFILLIRPTRYKLYCLISFLRTLPAFKTIQRILLSAITKG